MQFTNNDFQDIMLHRHSVRHFDSSVKIPRDELQQMVQEAITAPSSCNLQAWHFVVVDTPEGKDKLRSFFMKFNLSSARLLFRNDYGLWRHRCV